MPDQLVRRQKDPAAAAWILRSMQPLTRENLETTRGKPRPLPPPPPLAGPALSPSRTTSTWPACPPPPPARPSPTCRTASDRDHSACSAPARRWLGKTNLDQFACGLNGTRSPYGAVPNALRPPPTSCRRLELRLGVRGRHRRGWTSRWAPTPLARAACPPGLNNIVGLEALAARAAESTAHGAGRAERRIASRSCARTVAPSAVRRCCGSALGSTARDALFARHARSMPGASLRRSASACPAEPRLLRRHCSPRPPSPMRAGALGGAGRHGRHRALRARWPRPPRCSMTARWSPSATPPCAPSSTARGERSSSRCAASSRRAAATARPTCSTPRPALQRAGPAADRHVAATSTCCCVPTAPTHCTIAAMRGRPGGAQPRTSATTPTSSTCSTTPHSRCPPACGPDGLPFGITLIGQRRQRLATRRPGATLPPCHRASRGATGRAAARAPVPIVRLRPGAGRPCCRWRWWAPTSRACRSTAS